VVTLGFETMKNIGRQGLARTFASLGPITQLAFVPADFDSALRFWVETMGAGPFFLLEHVKMEGLRYRGQPAPDVDFSAAMGHWGDLQIELIRQYNDAPSIYSDWRHQGREGLHHVCVLTADMAAARGLCAAAGAEVLQEGTLRGGAAEIIYVDTLGGPGTMVEIMKPDPAALAFFARIRAAAKDWNGDDPLRRP